MAKESVIGRTKQKVIKDLILDNDIIEAMGNDLDGDDEIEYVYIYPYYHKIGTIEDTHSYICMQMDMIKEENSRSSTNPLFRRYVLTMYVIVHQRMMAMKFSDGMDRLDYLAHLIECKFDGRTDFGIGELSLIDNEENSLDENHRLRILTFVTKETTGSMCD